MDMDSLNFLSMDMDGYGFYKPHPCQSLLETSRYLEAGMCRGQKLGSKIRKIRRQNRMSISRIHKILRRNHLVRIQDIQELTPKQKFRIQDLQDPTAKTKNEDPGSPGSHGETKI